MTSLAPESRVRFPYGGDVMYWILAAVCAYLGWQLVAELVPALTLAFGLAIVVRPLHRRLEIRFASSGTVAAMVIVILLLAIAAPGGLLITRVARESLEAVNRIRAAAQSGDIERDLFHLHLSHLAGLSSAADSWLNGMDLESGIRQFSGYFAGRISAAISNSLWILTQVCIAIFALFFFLRDRELILDSIAGALPLSPAEVKQLFSRIGDTIYATLYGNLAVRMVQGLLGGAMFWALGLPAPVFWGSVMAVLSLVPFVGTGLVWAPAALYLLWQGSWIKALVLALWGAGVVSTIDNFLYPVIVGRELRLHTLAVFVAFIGGISAFGAPGVILGPVILSVSSMLIEISRNRKLSNFTLQNGTKTDRPQTDYLVEGAAQ